MGIFRTIASTLILAIFVYVSHQLTRFASFSWQETTLLVSFLGFLFALVLGSLLFFWKEKSLVQEPWRDTLLNVSLTTMAYINFLITLVILRDVLAFADRLSLPMVDLEILYSSEATFTLLGFPVLLLGAGHWVVRRGAQYKKVPLDFEGLHQDLHDLRIAHITDLHISPSLPPRLVKKLVQQIQKLKPDIIVFTGDILDSFHEKHGPEFEMLRKMQAPHGIYYVPGNHEYYWDSGKGLQAFRDAGFHVLINEVCDIQIGAGRMQIAGIPDPAALHFRQEGPDLEKVRPRLSNGAFKVLLSHQPSLAPQIEPLGIDLQLSGHTHGGQFFPWNLLIGFFERYSKGLYRVGNMQLYVNQGTGYWGPQLRLGTYCELTEIILRKP